MYPKVHSSTIYNSHVLDPKCPPANEWIKKLWNIYAMEYYTAERKKELLPFAPAWIDLETIMLSERQIPYDLTYKRNLIKKTSKNFKFLKKNMGCCQISQMLR